MTGHDQPPSIAVSAGPGEAAERRDRGVQVEEIADIATARAEIARLRQALARADARERTLVSDLQHRARNMLAMIRSIMRQTWEEGASQEEYAQHLQGRLDAIGRYQTRFASNPSAGLDLQDMARDELLPTCCLDGPRCAIDGPAVGLHERTAELVGLALHELATNAIKFGAFAGQGGLSVDWRIDRSRLEFRWTETGVGIASPAPRWSGFGRRLIEAGLPYELSATTSWDLRPGGLVCTIVMDLPDTRSGEPDPATRTKPRPATISEHAR